MRGGGVLGCGKSVPFSASESHGTGANAPRCREAPGQLVALAEGHPGDPAAATTTLAEAESIALELGAGPDSEFSVALAETRAALSG